MKQFFSLGPNCNVAHQLKIHGIRSAAGPFDWTGGHADNVALCADYLEKPDSFFAGLRDTTINNMPRLVNADDFQFTHHNVRDPQVAETMSRRLERVRQAAFAGEAFLMSQVTLFGNDQNITDRHLVGITKLRRVLNDTGGSTSKILSVIRIPANPSGPCLDIVHRLLASPEIWQVVFAPQATGYDPEPVWRFLDLWKV